MKKDLGSYRKSYQKNGLHETEMSANPLDVFEQWFLEAEKSGTVEEPNAMSLSTNGLDGFPKTRVVLLKQYSLEGFTFFTNFKSDKGLAIAADPRVCLSFFWPRLERQVIIKGRAEKVDDSISDDYFASRPEGSKLGAIVSAQSSVIPSRESLDERLEQLEKRLKGQKIIRPAHWGGYLVRPVSLEFWQGRPNRLHDRILYSLMEGSDWKRERLSP